MVQDILVPARNFKQSTFKLACRRRQARETVKAGKRLEEVVEIKELLDTFDCWLIENIQAQKFNTLGIVQRLRALSDVCHGSPSLNYVYKVSL